MIFIENIVFSIQKVGGISVVWYEHVKRLIADEELEIKFLEYPGANMNILRKTINIPADKILIKKSIFFRISRFLNLRLRYTDPFIFHSSNYRIAKNTNALNFVTVHDLIYFLSEPKSIKGKILKWIHCVQMSRAIKNADYLICVSKNTKNDLLKFFPNLKTRNISVIYNGVSDEYFPIHEKQILEIPFRVQSYVLYVGSRSRYKNFYLAVDAVSKTELILLIVGKELNLDEIFYLNHSMKKQNYSCLSNVDNKLLNQLYNGAYCLLYLSSYEGFGIPVIEAQKAGCPVIAFNSSSIPEIIGETPLLLDELSVEKILLSFEILKDSNLRETIINNGIKNSNNFSWDKTYAKVKNLYLEASTSISMK